MLININHLLLFIFFSTSFILRYAHLSFAHLFFRISFFLAGNVMYRCPITHWERHVSLSDYAHSHWERLVSLSDYAHSHGERHVSLSDYARSDLCPLLLILISAFVTLFACCVCLNFRCVHSPVATLLPSTSGCEWGGMLAGTLVYPPGLCGFAASC